MLVCNVLCYRAACCIYDHVFMLTIFMMVLIYLFMLLMMMNRIYTTAGTSVAPAPQEEGGI